jgi:hypothetical protein
VIARRVGCLVAPPSTISHEGSAVQRRARAAYGHRATGGNPGPGFAASTGGAHRTADVVGLLASFCTGPLFRAALQIWAAAAASDPLRALVLPLEARPGRAAHQGAVQLLAADESEPGVHEAVQATQDLARGLGLADTLAGDTRRRERVITQRASRLDAALAAPVAVPDC